MNNYKHYLVTSYPVSVGQDLKDFSSSVRIWILIWIWMNINITIKMGIQKWGGCQKPSQGKEERPIEETKENISLPIDFRFCTAAGSRPWSSGFHHIQEVPHFGTISKFPHKVLLGWHNSSVPAYYMNTCMTSYHMNTCTTSL